MGSTTSGAATESKSAHITASSTSRRRKGPSFLPSEHDSLPPNIAFLTIRAHSNPITALDFSEPYGLLASASSAADENVRLWDLSTGEQHGELIGHEGVVKCLQVENSVCITGGSDGKVRVWDLEQAEQDALLHLAPGSNVHHQQNGSSLGVVPEAASEEDEIASAGPCMRVLDAHTKDVTCLYFDGSCLVSPTLRNFERR